MSKETLLGLLEEQADHLGIKLRYERLEAAGPMSPGGLCRLRGEWVLFLNPAAPVSRRILLLVQALKKFDLTGVYLKPAVREILENPALLDSSTP
ncbi:MAG: hypothetical protein JRF59_10625 [Deltaproteobacteria bacterium]|mgnify:CR=1 FL=1|nr:hypothetical protein [Deltaproteobacteria bacterium]MBW1950122.1 hypothetical protein [Deltaproteobacteria bacterium]MBW2007049.1 hypothetical protein [Deltaproteobacteria bacterium]MBW2348282.1 hypothetical protein [Deltaproteobacteria bacterium]